MIEKPPIQKDAYFADGVDFSGNIFAANKIQT